MGLILSEVVPDSRSRAGRGARPGPLGQMWVPIYCANCGKSGGEVPEQSTTFAFWLCNPCFETYGELTTMMVVPDEVFWAKVQEAQMNDYGRLLSTEELVAIVEADASPLAALFRQRR